MILYIMVSILMGLVFYYTLRGIINLIFPGHSLEKIKSLVESENFDIDKELMRAEEERPGSTLGLYFDLGGISLIGCVFISFGVMSNIMGVLAWNVGFILFIIGVVMLLTPLVLWFISRPIKLE